MKRLDLKLGMVFIVTVLTVTVATIAIVGASSRQKANLVGSNDPIGTPVAVASTASLDHVHDVCTGYEEGVHVTRSSSWTIPFTVEAMSGIMPQALIATAGEKGPSRCKEDPPTIYTHQNLAVEQILFSKFDSPAGVEYGYEGGAVGKDTLQVGGPAQRLVEGQKYLLFVHPTRDNSGAQDYKVLTILWAFPVDAQGQVIESARKKIPLADAVDVVKTASKGNHWSPDR